ncbi:MAG: hypothetical protein CMB79_03530 [Filomicrobium sp.]|nr:hypothetical protein [Filomicrobium sp.]
MQRNNVSFSDGDIDALGAQTVGMSVTETYTICNTGTVELTGFNVGFANPSNLVDPGGSNP